MRVTTDMAQIELALTPFHSKLADLGYPYQTLRALRYGSVVDSQIQGMYLEKGSM